MTKRSPAQGRGGEQRGAEAATPRFPPGPAWAVGADAEHRGPSGLGPGEDLPAEGEETEFDGEGLPEGAAAGARGR
jgi:hypothetical protein